MWVVWVVWVVTRVWRAGGEGAAAKMQQQPTGVYVGQASRVCTDWHVCETNEAIPAAFFHLVAR